MRIATILVTAMATFGSLLSVARTSTPIYIVNGREMSDVKHIPQSDIESIEQLEINDESIARYGTRASNGVIVITLKYDKYASFEGGKSFEKYIASQVKWGSNEPAARVILRYTVGTDGKVTIGNTIEATDNRLRRKVVAAVVNAPTWTPASRNGVAVESEHVLDIRLPEGKEIPSEPYIRIL